MLTLREAFERALEKKKKYIAGLLTELEEAEEQYSMAFRSQMENIDKMMGIHKVIENTEFNLNIFPLYEPTC